MDFSYYQKTYLEFDVNRVIQGNAFNLVKSLPNNFLFHTVFSPPYYNARIYDTEPQVFENGECEHEWEYYVKKGIDGGKNSKKLAVKSTENFQTVQDTVQAVCKKCLAWEGEFGSEPFVEDIKFNGNTLVGYNTRLINLTELILEKTRPDGAVWVNLGDTYQKAHASTSTDSPFISGLFSAGGRAMEKSLIGIPQRFMVGMIDRGYIVRNEVIWYKRNAFPSPIDTRFTIDNEKMFFITKNNKPLYWLNEKTGFTSPKRPIGIKGGEGFDWEWGVCPSCVKAIGKNPSLGEKFLGEYRELIKTVPDEMLIDFITSLSSKTVKETGFSSVCKSKRCDHGKVKKSFWRGYDNYFQQIFEPHLSKNVVTRQGKNKSQQISKVNPTYSGFRYNSENYNGRNKRTTWDIPVKGTRLDHLAGYPVELVAPTIDSTLPQFFCIKCGLPVFSIFEEVKGDIIEQYRGQGVKDYESHLAQNPSDAKRRILESMRVVRNWKCFSNCGCNPPQLVKAFGFDPFMGTGTTAEALIKSNRNYLGFELNPKFFQMIKKRVKKLKRYTPITDFMSPIIAKPIHNPTKEGEYDGSHNVG